MNFQHKICVIHQPKVGWWRHSAEHLSTLSDAHHTVRYGLLYGTSGVELTAGLPQAVIRLLGGFVRTARSQRTCR
jgi:hypothetical protein